ncbi:LEA domain protein [Aspergillus thermomutatus]|uniref:DUF6987 domain-containing protein n=1 Tax=Aspergillus thermomutatus TaxID=41047 RepID=A0A397HDI6_ASPTH|nr:uncharacterized protein CDV56_104743 [Aspergillus thermomutatus]RHZ61132.1 hypothetical protein CDV56_104743 [Aspergillus thermomutatus]
MSSPSVHDPVQRNPATPRKSRKGSGSSAASSRPEITTPKTKKTPRKLQTRTPKPIEEDVDDEKPPTPSPQPKKKSQPEPQQREESRSPEDNQEEPEEQEEAEEAPPAPSPKPKKKKSKPEPEQRGISSPDDAQAQASGSASRSGKASDLAGTAKGLGDKLKDTAQDAGEKAQENLPSNPLDLSALKGLEVGEGGQVLGKDGNPLGRVVEGEPEDLVGQEIGDDGEILDEDGDLIGRVELLPDTARDVTDKAKEDLPSDEAQNVTDKAKENLPSTPLDLSALKGLEVGEGGQVLGQDGNTLGRVVEGEPEDLVGQEIGDDGEILDEDGDLIGRVELLPDAAQNVTDKARDVPEQAEDVASQAKDTADKTADQAKDKAEETTEQAKNVVADLADLDGLPVSEGGLIKNKDGQAIGKVAEGDPEDLVGYTVNDEGEIVDEDGDLIGRVELLPQEAQDVTDKAGEIPEQAKDTVTDLADLDGLPVSEEGAIKDKSGQVVAKIAEGDPEDLVGYTLNNEGEVLDEEGDLIGRAEIVPQQAKDATEGVNDSDEKLAPEDQSTQEDIAKQAVESVQQQGLDDTTEKAQSAAGDATDKVDEAAPDAEGVKDGAEEAAEAAEDEAEQQLPPLSSLEGMKCTKSGKIVDPNTGRPVGELIEGDPKKISRMGAQLDDKGQFWDSRGNVIGKAKTLPVEDYEDEPPFAGLEGLHVVEEGWVEDENGKRVGKIVQGDAKKLLGRAVDEDGDITDKNGNVIAQAEYYEAPDEPEPEKPDLSRLNGMKPNKMGFVIGPDGVPIARVVEGNPKELAGKEIDDGQIWEGRKPIGRVELIPEEEREKKPEGLFAGLDNLVVNKEGFVEDEDGNIVGKVTEGDPKKLRGRAVDEDGDIVDKFGNVKGHAEPYEPEEEEEEKPDLSILEGKTVNKAGNVVDAQGNIYGRITSGDGRLAGRKVDGQGQIWGDNGKVIGRAELVPGAEQEKPEGPFYGFDNAQVGKDGVVMDGGRIIGRVIEGDAKRLLGRKVDEDGDILDKNGNTVGKAERWEPEEKKRDVNPMSGRKVNKEGEVRDADGNLIGKLTSGNLPTLVGKEIDDNGYVVDNDGNKLGEYTLLENLPEEKEEEPEPGPSEEELEAQKKAEQDKELAKKMTGIIGQTLDRLHPTCKRIAELLEKADRTPRDELDEEKLVKDVKPLIEEGGQVLQECNGAIRALDPDGSIASTAKARAASHEATPEEYALAEKIKELSELVMNTIENGRKRIADMPHAKKKINPLWALLSEPLFQIIAAVGLLLSGVLGLVGRLLDTLGLGPLLNGLLGGLGLDKLLGGLGLSSITDSLGLTGKKD